MALLFPSGANSVTDAELDAAIEAANNVFDYADTTAMLTAGVMTVGDVAKIGAHSVTDFVAYKLRPGGVVTNLADYEIVGERKPAATAAGTFASLTDTPIDPFTGNAGRKVVVNATPNALVIEDDTLATVGFDNTNAALAPAPADAQAAFDALAARASDFISASDTPAAYAGAAQRFVRVNVAENAVEFVDLPITPQNLISGTAAPGAATGADGDYYLQLDAALGTNDLWGPKAAGAWPAQADFKSADPEATTPAQAISTTGTDYTVPRVWATEQVDQWGVSRRVRRVFNTNVPFDFTALGYADRTAVYIRNTDPLNGITITYGAGGAVTREITYADGTSETVAAEDTFSVQPSEIVVIEKDGTNVYASIIPAERIKYFASYAAANTLGGVPWDGIAIIRDVEEIWIRKTTTNSAAFPADGVPTADWVKAGAETAAKNALVYPVGNFTAVSVNDSGAGADGAVYKLPTVDALQITLPNSADMNAAEGVYRVRVSGDWAALSAQTTVLSFIDDTANGVDMGVGLPDDGNEWLDLVFDAANDKWIATSGGDVTLTQIIPTYAIHAEVPANVRLYLIDGTGVDAEGLYRKETVGDAPNLIG